MLPGFPLPLMGKALPAIGEDYLGGYFTGQFTDGGVLYNLIISPVLSGETTSYFWKNARSATSGTTSATDGKTNTANMLTRADHPLAGWVDGLSIGGFTDWYIPAVDEMTFLIANFRSSGSSPQKLTSTSTGVTSTQGTGNTSMFKSINTSTAAVSEIFKNRTEICRVIRRVAA